MNFLLISGAPSTGKTGIIRAIARTLINDFNFEDFDSTVPAIDDNENWDFLSVLTRKMNGTTIKIIINSPSDNELLIANLVSLYRKRLDVVFIISSARDGGDSMRDHFFSEINSVSDDNLFIEIPLAKITRRNNYETAIAWYSETVLNLVRRTLVNPPFQLL